MQETWKLMAVVSAACSCVLHLVFQQAIIFQAQVKARLLNVGFQDRQAFCLRRLSL